MGLQPTTDTDWDFGRPARRGVSTTRHGFDRSAGLRSGQASSSASAMLCLSSTRISRQSISRLRPAVLLLGGISTCYQIFKKMLFTAVVLLCCSGVAGAPKTCEVEGTDTRPGVPIQISTRPTTSSACHPDQKSLENFIAWRDVLSSHTSTPREAPTN